jgi:hypothetical protein
MTKVIISAAALAIVAGAASADRLPSQSVNSLEAVSISQSTLRGPGYTENFEAFSLGGGEQFGWTSAFPPNFTIENSGVPGFGARTAQHFSDVSDVAGFEIISPNFVAQGNIAADIQINDVGPAGTSLYQFVTVDTVAGFFNTRINFNSNGTIEALQAVGGVGVFAATTGSWTAGQQFRIGVEVLGDGTLNVYQNNSVIFTGVDIAFALTGANNGIDNVRIFAANTSLEGNDTLWLDNIGAIPAPGAAAVFGLAGLAGLRRRR